MDTSHPADTGKKKGAERLLTAVGGIAGRYLVEAGLPDTAESPAEQTGAARRRTVPPDGKAPPGGLARRKKHRLLRWGALAACLCLVVLGGTILLRHLAASRWPIKQAPASTASEPNTAPLPHWEELGISEQYIHLPFGGASYDGTTAQLEAGQVGEKLGDAVLSGQDNYTGETHTMPGAVHRIQGIADACAVAVRFEGETAFYVYRNSLYRPETLGQLIDDLNLRETLSLGSAWYNERKAGGQYAQIEFPDLPDEAVWEWLLADTGLPNVWSDANTFLDAMSVSVDIPLLGYTNISLGITEDGYLTTNILDTGKAFYIGQEAAQGFMGYVLENCTGYEIVYTDPDESALPE
ncbi:MAG TPA: hypothetical protein H9694_05285 [Firmicutes bacterium]|nr:hypothetical protein [Bacillota bacterium]